MHKSIFLRSADGIEIPAYLATPVGAPKGGVVIVQEIFGVNSHIRSVADRYAAQGYLALAPSTFHRVQPHAELGYGGEDMKAGSALKAAADSLPPPGVLQDIQAAIDYAGRAGKVGIVGFCWGGLLAWRAACMLHGLSAAVCYYGGGMTAPGEAGRQPKVPVLAHFGNQDAWIPLDGVEALKKAHPDVEVRTYPATHGFNCDERASYEPASARLAEDRTFAFFVRNLA